MSNKEKHEELRHRANRDWSLLNSLVVGGEVFPTTDWEKIELLKREVESLQARNERLEKALDFCKINNHKDNWGGKTYCRGHECPVCAKIEEAKAVLEEGKK